MGVDQQKGLVVCKSQKRVNMQVLCEILNNIRPRIKNDISVGNPGVGKRAHRA